MQFLSSEATLIYNPHSGFRDWSNAIKRVACLWEAQGWTVHMLSTTSVGHATALAQAAAAARHGLVLAAGGDGTLNEVANGLVYSETVLAPLPVGTANTFAKELGLAGPQLLHPNWLLGVSLALLRGRIQRMDVGKCDNGRYWLLWAGTGIDGFMVEQIEPRPRWFKRLGQAGYAAAVLFFLPQFSGIHAAITIDNRTIVGDYLLISVSNCRLFAGGKLRLNYVATLDDGTFEVWLFQGRDWPMVLGYMLDISHQTHLHNPGVEVTRSRYVAVHAVPATHFHVDGEPLSVTPFACTLIPHALRVLVPDTTPCDLFSMPGEWLAA